MTPDPMADLGKNHFPESGSPVSFRHAPDGYSSVDRVIRTAVEDLGGIASFVKPGERILIKPNLLAPAAPDQAVVTHPEVFRAVAGLVLEAGGIPLVGDSPPFRSLQKLMEKTGHLAVARELNVPIVEFRESVEVPVPGPFRKIEVSKEALEADGIINLPKLKTHGQMGMTLAVKNLFGCIIGMKKPEWHFRAGSDADLFASVIVGVFSALRPRLNIVDGVLAMEGDGPGLGGTPRKLGWIVAGADASAVDYAICEALGVQPEQIPTIRCSGRDGLQVRPVLVGEPPSSPGRFRLPGERKSVVFGPRLLHGFLRSRATARPWPKKNCILCGECIRYCPAKAMSRPQGRKPVVIDYNKCIRCYCCLEVCPHGAIEVRAGWFGRGRRPTG